MYKSTMLSIQISSVSKKWGKKNQNCKMHDASIINDLIGTMRKILLCYLFFIDVMNMLLLN